MSHFNALDFIECRSEDVISKLRCLIVFVSPHTVSFYILEAVGISSNLPVLDMVPLRAK